MKKKRKICFFCGAKKYTEFMREITEAVGFDFKPWGCKNDDRCIERMVIYKHKNKKNVTKYNRKNKI